MMRSWESYQVFHSHGFKEIPEWRQYKPAVDTIEAIFKPLINFNDTYEHPVMSRLGMGWIENYKWMDQFARLLLRARLIPGIEPVWQRLGSPIEYHSALTEIETALLFSLTGHEVKFVECTQSKTPDLEVKLNGITFNVEVSSLNSHELDAFHMIFMNAQMWAHREKVSTGGILGAPRDWNEATMILDAFKSTIQKVQIDETLEIIEIPGLAKIWVAFGKGVEEMPSHVPGRFSFGQRHGRSIEERLERKILRKMGQLQRDDNPSLFFVYLRTHIIESEDNIFYSEHDNMKHFLSTCSDITELILIGPEAHVPGESYDNQKLSSIKTRLSYPSINWRDRPCVIWKNLYPKQEVVIPSAQLIKNFPLNIKDLPPLA